MFKEVDQVAALKNVERHEPGQTPSRPHAPIQNRARSTAQVSKIYRAAQVSHYFSPKSRGGSYTGTIRRTSSSSWTTAWMALLTSSPERVLCVQRQVPEREISPVITQLRRRSRWLSVSRRQMATLGRPVSRRSPSRTRMVRLPMRWRMGSGPLAPGSAAGSRPRCRRCARLRGRRRIRHCRSDLWWKEHLRVPREEPGHRMAVRACLRTKSVSDVLTVRTCLGSSGRFGREVLVRSIGASAGTAMVLACAQLLSSALDLVKSDHSERSIGPSPKSLQGGALALPSSKRDCKPLRLPAGRPRHGRAGPRRRGRRCRRG